MSVRDIWSAAFRRPWLLLAVLGLCGLWGFHEVAAPPVYEARVVVTLLSPTTPFPANSYASFTSGLVLLADVSARSADSPAMHDRIRRQGGTADYQVVLANRGSQEVPIHDQPYLWVSATSTDPGEAQRTLDVTMRTLRAQLRERQQAAGASDTSLVTWRVTSGSGEPVALRGQPTRQLAGVGVLTLLVTGYVVRLGDRRGWRLPRPGRSGRGNQPPGGPAAHRRTSVGV